MTVATPFIDPEIVDTPAGLSATVALADIAGIPSDGPGLAGAVYAPGDEIRDLEDLAEVIAANPPDAEFAAQSIAYAAKQSDTTIAEFLGDDAASLQGDGGLEMGPSGITLTGFIFIPAGVHTISVVSDDGFSLSIGGVPFSEFDGKRSIDDTSRSAEFEGGLYEIELAYFDAHGAMALALLIDGLTVDDSALYPSVEAFENPPADVPLAPVEDYHPSQFLGAHILDGDDLEIGLDTRDVIDGQAGDDTIIGNGGDDALYGGYGDDSIEGGDGDDVLDGGRGSDLLDGGAGNDLLISRSDAGEQRIGQLAIGAPTRGDPDGEVNPDRQKLYGWEDMPFVADDILIGGAGFDTFLISPQINAKLDIIQKHVRSDGTINWAGVAGENDELHDHWVDSFGIDIIADYVAGEDQIAVIGHTANVYVDHRDTDGDGDEESIITVISKQHGAGGAHDRDLIGQVIVHGDRVEADDIQTDANVTYGVVESYDQVAEAIYPQGDLKETVINGETVFGYDTREPGDELGPITGAPEDFIDNPYLDSVTFGDPTPATEEIELTRYPFEQLGFDPVAGQTETGGAGADLIAPDQPAAPAGLPGAVAYYSLSDGVEGAYEDARGGPSAKAYTLFENQALLRTDGAVAGPNAGVPGGLSFNGEDEFAYIAHDQAAEISQGTIAIWVKPEDLDDCSIFLSKDQKNTGDGGHFRLGHTDDGGLLLRMAPGDGSSNRAWETKHGGLLTEGEWAHIAVNFGADGVTVFINGQAVADNMWKAAEGEVPTPGVYQEAFFIQNEEPWVLGADQARTEINDTAQVFAIDDEDLDNAYEGALAGFGVWGGEDAADILTPSEINQLITEGPGAALTNPSGPEPMTAGDDVFAGGGGNDTILGEGGNDTLSGDAGDDSILGGYGDDLIAGGAGNDTIDGGRGSDLIQGGEGDDLLISRADVGEDRIGQLVLPEYLSRDFPDPSVDPTLLKLVDWVDQPLVADDILIGGAGKDHFLFETLINGKKDILLDNLLAGSREIDWSGNGVAGENDRLHDHWVDALGIEIIADYDASEDQISVIGHTTNIRLDYLGVDTSGDGVDDSIVSIITAYSQQGNNGGAHDEDLLGYIVVHGDIVEEDDVTINPNVHYGVVDTIDELNEALAPTGETKISTGPNGETLFGYDSRDVDGDPIGSNPEAFSSNPYRDLVDYADQRLYLDPLTVLLSDAGGDFDGATAVEIAHDPALQQAEGTFALSFTATDPGGENQALLSKDHSGFEDGGHLTVWLDKHARVNVRFQSEDESIHLKDEDNRIAAGEETHVAFSFDGETLSLYVNGQLADAEDGFAEGMLGNDVSTVLGASTRQRRGDDLRLEWFFTGAIGAVIALDRTISGAEALLLAENDGDPSVLLANVGEPPADDGPDVPPVDDEPGDDTPVDPPVDEDPDGEEPGDEEPGDDQPGDDGPQDDDEEDETGEDDPEEEMDPIVLIGDGGADELAGDSGDDMLAGRGGRDTLTGGAGEDTLAGGGGRDSLSGGADGDVLRGQGGRDWLGGDGGDDRLLGGGGRDTIEGGEGDDRLIGGGGADLLEGGVGNDVLRGGGGPDTLIGGEGDDRLIGQNGRDIFVFSQGDGVDTIRGFQQNGRDKLMIASETVSFDDVAIDQVGRNVVVSFDDVSIILRREDADDITIDDFIF